MASILQINGRWRALVRRKGQPSFCQTFGTKAQAAAWARQIEADIDRGQAPRADAVLGRLVLVSHLVSTYRKLREQARPIRDDSNEHYMLKVVDRLLGDLDATRLQVSDLVDFCKVRGEEGAGPYTINMDLGKLGTVMRLTAAHLKLQLPDVVAQARPLLSHMGLIGGGGKRERRPNDDELAHVLAWLAEHKGQVYADVVAFAVGSAMRRSEIARVAWADLDAKKKTVLVRDRKHPRQKKGNDMHVPLLGGMWDLVQRQPSKHDPAAAGRIFPIHPQTISKYFKQACDALGVPDLRLHDMRHDGISKLFEAGFGIPQVALVSGHQNWNNLKRYTNLKPEDLHHGPAGAPPAPGRAERRGTRPRP
jgi:integrase